MNTALFTERKLKAELEKRKATMTVEERLKEEYEITKGYKRKCHYFDFDHTKKLIIRLQQEGKQLIVIPEEWQRGNVHRIEYSVYWKE